jgi:hypothetical protein
MFKVMKTSTLAILLLLMTAGSLQAGQHNGINRIDDLSIDVWVNKNEASTYYYGEDLAIYFRANSDCYVVVYDIDPSGNVSLLFPSDYSGSCRVNGDEVYRIPDAYDDYRLEISGPSGSEYIYAVATYNPIDPPDFIRYENFDYGNWDYYYDDFIHSVSGERAAFATDLNNRIANAPHVSASTMFYIDEGYRHHKWYRHWTYDPYYTGSVWVGVDYPGCEIWIDGIYYGIAPILIPQIYIGRHWVWIYYHGYPCWQDYVYINHGQRYYVDAKINHRYLDYDYGRKNMRDWRFKYEKYRNEPDFKHKADQDRAKYTPAKQTAPIKVVDKYSKRKAADYKSSPITGNTIETKTRDSYRKSEPADNSSIKRVKQDRSEIGKKPLISEPDTPIIKDKSIKTDSDADNTGVKSQQKTEKSNQTKSVKVKQPTKSKSNSSAVKQSRSAPSSGKQSKSSSSGSKQEDKRSKR